MITIPNQSGWKQPNIGDRQGNIWSSRNLDLTTKAGVLRVSPRLLLGANTSDLANLGAPACAFKFWGSGHDIWIAANARMFVISNAGPNGTIAQDATSGTPTALNSNQTDIEEFNGYLYVSGASTSLFKLDSSSVWSTITSKVSNTSGLHDLEYFRALNRLYFVDGNGASVGSIDTTDTSATLGTQYTLQNLVAGGSTEIISWIKSNSSRIWIGTINFSNKQGRIYAWDGAQSSGPNEIYTIEAVGTYSCVIKDDVPYVFDTEGRLLVFNGGTFREVARLPFENKRTHDISGVVTNRMMHYNGMALVKGKINMLVNTTLWDNADQVSTSLDEKVPSGVWEYAPEIGLYHKASVGLTKSGGTIRDYGQQRISQVGGLAELNIKDSTLTVASLNGSYMLGCDYYTNATTSTSGIFYDDFNDTLQKYGYVVLSKIFSSQIQETWQKLYIKHRKLLSSTDKIVVKYRTDDVEPVEATITWVNTSSFTTTTNVSAYNPSALGYGPEVEITQGDGSGKCAHISAITESGGTYTVTLDDTFTGITTNTAKARFQFWKKVAEATSQSVTFSEFPMKETSTWVQLKVGLQFTGKDEVQELVLANKPQQLAE